MGPANSLVVCTPATNTDAVLTSNGTAFSSPALVRTTGSDYGVAMVGPGDSMSFAWTSSGTFNGPAQIGGANTTYSAPSILREPGGNLDVAVEGPNNSLAVYWESGGTWHGPNLVPGSYGTIYSSSS
jgi:hypothetical protein